LKIQFGEREFEVDVKIVISVAIALVCVVAYLFTRSDVPKSSAPEVTMFSCGTAVPSVRKDGEQQDAKEEIRVYVTGCVKNEGVYSLPGGSLIVDAVEAAGGFTKDANKDFNLVWKLKKNCVIRIPKKGENVGDICTDELTRSGQNQRNKSSKKIAINKRRRTKESKNGLININRATKSELMKLNGVGEVIAERIIGYRKSARFKQVEDLKNVSGIGEKTFENMKDFICTK